MEERTKERSHRRVEPHIKRPTHTHVHNNKGKGESNGKHQCQFRSTRKREGDRERSFHSNGHGAFAIICDCVCVCVCVRNPSFVVCIVPYRHETGRGVHAREGTRPIQAATNEWGLDHRSRVGSCQDR